MSDRFPDIEIYVKRPAMEALLAWLDRRLGVVETRKRGETFLVTLGEPPIECAIVENAVKGGFASVWFKSPDTPWSSDHECAVEAFRELGLEVRCSTGSWQEEDESARWFRITENGESMVNWL